MSVRFALAAAAAVVAIATLPSASEANWGHRVNDIIERRCCRTSRNRLRLLLDPHVPWLVGRLGAQDRSWRVSLSSVEFHARRLLSDAATFGSARPSKHSAVASPEKAHAPERAAHRWRRPASLRTPPRTCNEPRSAETLDRLGSFPSFVLR